MKIIVFILFIVCIPAAGNSQFSTEEGASPLTNTVEVNVRVVPYIELILEGVQGTLLSRKTRESAFLDFGTIDAFGIRPGKQVSGRIGRLRRGGAVYSAKIALRTRFTGLGKGQGKLKVSRVFFGGSDSLSAESLLEGPSGARFEGAVARYAMVQGREHIIASGIENSVSSFIREVGIYVRPEDAPGVRRGKLLYTFVVE